MQTEKKLLRNEEVKDEEQSVSVGWSVGSETASVPSTSSLAKGGLAN